MADFIVDDDEVTDESGGKPHVVQGCVSTLTDQKHHRFE
jgi:hypothetical protein